MKTIVLFLLLIFSFNANAQYYYNDIIGTMELNRQMKLYQANKVKMISATGTDQNGVKSTTFAEVQEVKENGNVLRISTRNGSDYSVIYNRFDAQTRLISSIDSSSTVISTTTYQYDATGKINRIENTTKDEANDFNQSEVHQWVYDAAGNPTKMWRIINNTDSLEIRFFPDEDGMTGDEKTFRKGVETGAIYYYYDDNKRLTDIVRYHSKLKKLLPDMMFEYDEQNRVIQKITTTPSINVSYLIWRYIYDSKGLKTKEALFNDDKQLTGKIEYAYTFL
jgi:hypothetical protein